MPVETLRPPDARLPGGPLPSAMPFRILNKGPGYFRRPADPGARKLSAVERLEADKAKYVKSQQVALTRQAPIQPPIIRKPLLSPGMMLQCRISTPPARKVPRRPADSENGGGGEGERAGRRGPHLNLEILNNLINNVCDGPPSSSSPSASNSASNSASSPSSGAKSIGSSLSAEQERSARPLLLSNHPAPASSSTSSCTSSSPLNATRGQAPPDVPSRRPPPVPARGLRVGPPAPYSSPNSVTVRRVDVRPQVEARKPQRPQLPPKPQPPQVKPRQTAQPQAPPTPQQPQPQTPAKALPSPLPYLPPSPMLFRAGMMPPASPAFTRLSNASSRGSARKHPSLHRSKSDLSDRYSRATADLERFFNYCGLDPQEVEGLGGVERFARAASDIVSVSKMRSVSTPSSEYGQQGEQEQEEEGEGPTGANERIPYGISVIERNARVIKWLYGIRQARDGSGVSNV